MTDFNPELFLSTLALIGVVIVISALLSGLVERSGLPQVAVFLGLGATIGPYGLGLINIDLHSPILRVVGTLSLVLVLFTDAVSLNLREVRKHSKLSTLVLGPGTLLSAFIIAFFSWWLLKLPVGAALVLGAFPPEPNTPAVELFLAGLERTEFEIGWKQFRKGPTFKTYLLAGLIFVLPKVGHLSELSIRGPEPGTAEKYIESVNRSAGSMRDLLNSMEKEIALPNRDLDTGDRVKPGGYPLTDETYAKLLDEITHSPSQTISSALKQNIVEYYSDPNAPITTKKNAKEWQRVQKELQTLASRSVTTE